MPLNETIQPHGGVLINRFLQGEALRSAIDRSPSLPTITLSTRQISDLELISTGAASPLTGFMGLADYQSVVRNMRLASGLPWSIPVTLAVNESVPVGSDVADRKSTRLNSSH